LTNDKIQMTKESLINYPELQFQDLAYEELTEAAGESQEFYLNMGPQHPSTHGVLRLLLRMDGERIKEAIPVIGHLHRALEKIAENRTYLQFIPLTDRIDYTAAMNCNLGYVLAVEKLGEISVPARAEFIRVIMAELNRIASHLIWFGTFLLDLGATTPFAYAFREREKIIDLFEMACGARLTYNYMRFGGVAFDLPLDFIKNAKAFIPYFRKMLNEYEMLVTENIIFLGRTKNIGILPLETAIDKGVSGPNLRASGLKWDLRKNKPYSGYEKFNFEIPTGSTGDVWDRYYVRMQEMRQSLLIIEQALEGLPEGGYLNRTPYRLTLPPGEVYLRTEAPRGELGIYLVSRGEESPHRLKIRTGSFSNLYALPELIRGVIIPDAVAISGSLDIVLPEVDR
jgi:NADH-quinone oxidoreductase subunit D